VKQFLIVPRARDNFWKPANGNVKPASVNPSRLLKKKEIGKPFGVGCRRTSKATI
jgi:hypothetical protein